MKKLLGKILGTAATSNLAQTARAAVLVAISVGLTSVASEVPGGLPAGQKIDCKTVRQ